MARFLTQRLRQGSLGSKTLRALGWNFGGTVATYALRLASNLIMTRLLVPDAFGMLAFAMTFVTALGMLTDIGIHQSIVKESRAMGPRYLRTAWSIRIIRSLVIAVGVLAIALGIFLFGSDIGRPDSVFAEPVMPLLLAIAAAQPVIDGLVSTNWNLAERRLDFKRLILIELFTSVFRISLQIAFALVSPTVWALLFGTLVGNVSKTVLSHLYLNGPRMRWCMDKRIADELWGFGKWIMGSSALYFIVDNGEKLILGALISSFSLGLLVIAQIWLGALRSLVLMVIGKVGFPVISEILRDRPKDARRLLRKYQFMVDALCGPGCLVLAFLGPPAIGLIYTDDYHGAGRLLQLLAPAILAARFSVLGNLIIARGHSRTLFLVSAIEAASTVLFLVLGFRLGGLEGAIFGLVLARFVPVPLILARTFDQIGIRQTVYDASWCAGSVLFSVYLYAFA